MFGLTLERVESFIQAMISFLKAFFLIPSKLTTKITLFRHSVLQVRYLSRAICNGKFDRGCSNTSEITALRFLIRNLKMFRESIMVPSNYQARYSHVSKSS